MSKYLEYNNYFMLDHACTRFRNNLVREVCDFRRNNMDRSQRPPRNAFVDDLKIWTNISVADLGFDRTGVGLWG